MVEGVVSPSSKENDSPIYMDLKGRYIEQHVAGHQDGRLGIVSHAIWSCVERFWSVDSRVYISSLIGATYSDSSKGLMMLGDMVEKLD
jgi:hypothetical protein